MACGRFAHRTNNPRKPKGCRGLFHDNRMSRYGCDAAYGRASGRMAEEAQMGRGVEEDLRMGVFAALAFTYRLSNLDADEEGY